MSENKNFFRASAEDGRIRNEELGMRNCVEVVWPAAADTKGAKIARERKVVVSGLMKR